MPTMLRKMIGAATLGLLATAGSVFVGSSGAFGATEIFNNSNGGGVTQGRPTPPAATIFTLTRPETITSVWTYHFNGGRGTVSAGTIYLTYPRRGYPIAAEAKAQGSSGQGGVRNANWTASFNVTLPAGRWQIWDSSPSTWSYDTESGDAGFAQVEGQPASGGRGIVPTTPVRTTPTVPPAPTTPTTSPAASPFRPCYDNTYFRIEMGPCFGPAGTTITIGVVAPLSSPLEQVMFVNGTARVFVLPGGLMGGGVSPGSLYTFSAPASLCLAGHGSSTWSAYAWDANALANPQGPFSNYGDQGDFGTFTITGC